MQARYRNALPQLGDRLFLLDGGMETKLIFIDGVDLPFFAAFNLLLTPEGEEILEDYYQPYVELALQSKRGLILETPTWRASQDWGSQLGFTAGHMAAINQRSAALMERIRDRFECPETPMVISGCLGPRGDGYVADERMTVAQARDYHQPQIDAFRDSAADMVAALTLNTTQEATGIVQAAQRAGMPVVISFTTETDGYLPSGTSLRDAIEAVDDETDQGPVYYMINCAHPDHFSQALEPGQDWTRRIRGLRANASRKSHQELDGSDELDIGDPGELGRLYASLRDGLGHITVLGGCCGTDIRHIEAINSCCH